MSLYLQCSKVQPKKKNTIDMLECVPFFDYAGNMVIAVLVGITSVIIFMKTKEREELN